MLWENSIGRWDVLIDGATRSHGKEFSRGHVVLGRGHLFLGKPLAGIAGAVGFVGTLTQFHWESQRTAPEVAKLASRLCNVDVVASGAIARWKDFGVTGCVRVTRPSRCTSSGES